jgi:hypothetical protein
MCDQFSSHSRFHEVTLFQVNCILAPVFVHISGTIIEQLGKIEFIENVITHVHGFHSSSTKYISHCPAQVYASPEAIITNPLPKVSLF